MKNILTKALFISIVLLLSTSSASALTCTNLTKSLSKGSENSEVRTLQQFLFDGGYLTAKPNGYFGDGTLAAVKRFQTANGLSPVGSIGEGTRNKIKEVSCKSPLKISQTSTASSPSTRENDANNSKRTFDLKLILNAVNQYIVDNKGTPPSTITTNPTEICSTNATSCAGLVDLRMITRQGKYLATIPRDPQVAHDDRTGYLISRDSAGQITVKASLSEGNNLTFTGPKVIAVQTSPVLETVNTKQTKTSYTIEPMCESHDFDTCLSQKFENCSTFKFVKSGGEINNSVMYTKTFGISGEQNGKCKVYYVSRYSSKTLAKTLEYSATCLLAKNETNLIDSLLYAKEGNMLDYMNSSTTLDVVAINQRLSYHQKNRPNSEEIAHECVYKFQK